MKAAPKESTGDTDDPPRRSVLSRPAVMLALLVVVTVALDANILDNRFLGWDDSLYVTENARVQISSLSDLARVVSPEDALAGRFVEYFPLRDAIYALLFFFFGLEPTAYHVTQIAFHLGATALLFVCARRWIGEKPAVAAAALFAIHPVHVESVAWIAALKDPLFTMLVLSSVHFYERYRTAEGRRWLPYAASVGLLVLALLCKSIAIVTPVLLLLGDWLARRDLRSRGVWLDKIPHGVVCILALWLIVAVGRANSVIVEPPGGTAATGFMTMTMVFARYLWTLVFPFELSARYVIDPVMTPLDVRFLAAVAVIAVLFVLAVRYRKRSRVPLFGLAWLTVALLPVMNIVPIPIEMADRYLYLPSIGFCVVVAWAAGRALEHRRLRNPAAMAITIVFVVLGLATQRRNDVWQNDIVLWEDVVERAPTLYIGRNHLARAYITEGRYEDAREQLEAALEVKPDHVPSLMNLGGLYERQERYDAARRAYERVLSIEPDYDKALNNIGVLFIRQQRFAEARPPLERAVAASPEYPHAHRNLGFVCFALGDAACALRHIERAVDLRPADRATFLDLLRILEGTGRLDRLSRWRSHFEHRFAADPEISAAWRRLTPP